MKVCRAVSRWHGQTAALPWQRAGTPLPSPHHPAAVRTGTLLLELSKLGPDVDALTLGYAGLERACVRCLVSAPVAATACHPVAPPQRG